MKRIIIFTAALFVLGYLFILNEKRLSSGEFEITDVSKDTIFIAVDKKFINLMTGIVLKVEGNVDDEIKILNKRFLKGEINEVYTPPEIYTDTVRITYKANNAKKGKIKVSYQFIDVL